MADHRGIRKSDLRRFATTYKQLPVALRGMHTAECVQSLKDEIQLTISSGIVCYYLILSLNVPIDVRLVFYGRANFLAMACL
jgi:hypothetical protein